MKIGDTPTVHGRILLYSDYGAGKTYLLGQLHNELKKNGSRGLYLMDLDVGHKTLSSAGIFDDLEFDIFVGKDAYKRWEDKLGEFANDNHGFGGLAIDSLSTLEKITLKHIIKNIAASKDRPLGFLPSLQDQGCLVNIIENIMPFLQSLSLHMTTVMTAHMQERRSDETSVLWMLPCVTGRKLPSKLGAYFNEVWHIEADKVGDKMERTVQTATFDRFKCKTQIKNMPLRLPAEDALKLAVKAYDIGAILDKDEADEQAQKVVKETGGQPSILGVKEKLEDEEVEELDVTRKELMEATKK